MAELSAFLWIILIIIIKLFLWIRNPANPTCLLYEALKCKTGEDIVFKLVDLNLILGPISYMLYGLL